MHYVYLTDNTVIDQTQIDPFKVFQKDYASQFIEAPDEVTFGWQLKNNKWISPPEPVKPDAKIENKQKAKILLDASDWSQYSDVVDINNIPHLLNSEEWKNYRIMLRKIVIDPPETLITDWPSEPDAIWSK